MKRMLEIIMVLLIVALLAVTATATWHIVLRCTPTIAFTRVWETNTNTWVFEYIENGGTNWTWCGNWVTGNTEAVFYKNPNSMMFRARKVD